MVVLPILIALAAAASPPPDTADASPHIATKARGVNLIAGDLSAIAGYVPTGLPAAIDERARVRGHLLFAHDVLARVDTSGWPTALRLARAHNLDRLQRYATAGGYPYNDDHPDAHRPTFVDRAGTLCAVGALLAADRGRDAAERIAATHKYAFIEQIRDGELAMWQQQSGLSPDELALIQPAYMARPEPIANSQMWLPFGLLDRIQIAPFRASATTELGTSDDFATSSLTLHAQMSTPCDCRIGAYGTLPASILLDADGPGIAAAGGPIEPQMARTILGTADVGLFGANKGRRSSTLFRVGALLPTGARQPHHKWLPSARVGDAVLELPRSAGVRLSTSKLMGWHTMPQGLIKQVFEATRVDLGLDVAVELVGNVNPVHVVPRAGIGTLLVREGGTLSLDTAISLDPAVDRNINLRWSAGLTGRLARVDGEGWFLHPAVSLAVVRTIDGWGGNILFDLAATARPSPSPSYGDS